MKKSLEIWIIAAIVAPLLYLAYIWPEVPSVVPTHFGLSGKPDAYGSKATLWIFAAVQLFVYFVLRYAPTIDPKVNSVSLSAHYPKLRLLIAVFMSAVHVLIIKAALNEVAGEAFENIIFVGVFVLIAGIGNYLNNIKPNYFVGIRTPWTLENPEVWRKTHQWAAKAFFVAGIVGAVVVVWLPSIWKVFWTLTLILGVAFWAVWYSYQLYKKSHTR